MNPAITMNTANEDLVLSPYPTIKQVPSFGICAAPILRKDSFDYNMLELHEPSNNLLLPMLDEEEQVDTPNRLPMLRPRQEPLALSALSSSDLLYIPMYGATRAAPTTPMRMPELPEISQESSRPSFDYVSDSDASSCCPMSMALDDDSLSLSDNESLEGLPFAPCQSPDVLEPKESSEDSVICNLTARFRSPTTLHLQPRRSRTPNESSIFRGKHLQFPAL